MVEPHPSPSRRPGWRLAVKVGLGLWIGYAILVGILRTGMSWSPSLAPLHAWTPTPLPSWGRVLHFLSRLALLASVVAPLIVGGLRLRHGRPVWPTLRDTCLAAMGVPLALLMLRGLFALWGPALLGITAFDSDLANRAALAPALLGLTALASLGTLRLFTPERVDEAAPAVVLSAMAAGVLATLAATAWALRQPSAQVLAIAFVVLGVRLVLLAGSHPRWRDLGRGALAWLLTSLASVGGGVYAQSFQHHDEFGLTPVLMGLLFPVVAPTVLGVLGMAWWLTRRKR